MRTSRTALLVLLVVGGGCGRVRYERLFVDSSDADVDASDADVDASDADLDAGDAGDADLDAGDAGDAADASNALTCSLRARRDGTVDDFAGGHADGTGVRMYSTSDGASTFYSFFAFDVATATCLEGGAIPAGALVESATLQLTLTQTCGGCAGRLHAIRRVTGAWSEATLAPGAGPAVAEAPSAGFDVGSAPSEFLLQTALLRDDVQGFLDAPATDQGFRLEQSAGTGNAATPFGWSTREGPAAPLLVVRYVMP